MGRPAWRAAAYRARTLDAVVTGPAEARRFNAPLLQAFASLAPLTMIGISGVVGCTVGQCAREIGVPVVPGAPPAAALPAAMAIGPGAETQRPMALALVGGHGRLDAAHAVRGAGGLQRDDVVSGNAERRRRGKGLRAARRAVGGACTPRPTSPETTTV